MLAAFASGPSQLVWYVILALYRWKGWKLTNVSLPPRQCVILGAPHTTNWDFVFFLGVAHEVGIKPSFMGKLSLFKWPFRRFMLEMGGIPIDRRAKDRHYVDQVISVFSQAQGLALVIAPEGTRGAITAWRSGFYHIAHGAGVPIIPSWVDHVRMKGGFGPAIATCGDYLADLKKIAAFYYSVMPDHPKLAVLYAQAGLGGATSQA